MKFEIDNLIFFTGYRFSVLKQNLSLYILHANFICWNFQWIFYLDNEDDDEGHGYLHPSLMVTRKASPAPEVPAYKPLEMPKVSVHDTPYGQLIKSLVKKQQPDATEEWVKSSF